MEIYRKTFEANFRPAHADAEVVAASQKRGGTRREPVGRVGFFDSYADAASFL